MNKISYELHYGKKVVPGRLEDLRRLTKTLSCPWNIYGVVRSSMEQLSKEKMTIIDMREALRLNKRGYSKHILAKKYHVCEEYMNKVISQMKRQPI